MVAVRQHRNRASAQAGFISQLCRGQHSGLRPSFASMQQPAEFFCKEFLSERHRLEAPISVSGEWFRGNRRPRRSRVCEPWRCKSSLAHQFTESKPQQTGTRLLPGHGEVATTSGSTILWGYRLKVECAGSRGALPNLQRSTFNLQPVPLPRGVISSISGFDPDGPGAIAGRDSDQFIWGI